MTPLFWTPETDAEHEAMMRQMVALRTEDDGQQAPPPRALPDFYLPATPRGGVIVRFSGGA